MSPHSLRNSRAEQSRAVAYCRQPASTVTPGIEPRWDPWPYICSMSRLLSLSSFFRCSSFNKKGGVGLFYNWCSLTTHYPTRGHIKVWDVYMFYTLFTYMRNWRYIALERKSQPFYCCVVRGNMFIEPLPRNGFRNMAVLLLRTLATACLPSISLPTKGL
jgi:hypothetical protein